MLSTHSLKYFLYLGILENINIFSSQLYSSSFMWTNWDSNPDPEACKATALPLELPAHSPVSFSFQYGYWRTSSASRDNRIRTCDLMLPKHARYLATLHPGVKQKTPQISLEGVVMIYRTKPYLITHNSSRYSRIFNLHRISACIGHLDMLYAFHVLCKCSNNYSMYYMC